MWSLKDRRLPFKPLLSGQHIVGPQLISAESCWLKVTEGKLAKHLGGKVLTKCLMYIFRKDVPHLQLYKSLLPVACCSVDSWPAFSFHHIQWVRIPLSFLSRAVWGQERMAPHGGPVFQHPACRSTFITRSEGRLRAFIRKWNLDRLGGALSCVIVSVCTSTSVSHKWYCVSICGDNIKSYQSILVKTARGVEILGVHNTVGRGPWAAQGRGSASSCGSGGVLASPGPPWLTHGPWRLCLGLCSSRAGKIWLQLCLRQQLPPSFVLPCLGCWSSGFLRPVSSWELAFAWSWDQVFSGCLTEARAWPPL